jgi:GNAT superfamily N-acetyltransferase
MHIRPMEARDAADVAALSGELGYPAAEADVAERWRVLEGREDHAVLVAEQDDRIAGWIHVHDDWTLEAGRAAELMGLVVGTRHRGAGIGHALVAEAERWARTRGCARLRVRSNVVRTRAHRFYDTLGYERVKTQQVFDKRV